MSNEEFRIMSYLTDKIRSAMTDDGRRASPFPLLLSLLSGAYGGGLRFRRLLYRFRLFKTRRLPCRVVSIGNITAGGTGKTPMTIYVARLVQRLGFKTAVLSRGYKGSAEKKGGIVSDGRQLRMTAAAAGDEPVLIAASLEGIPVLVGRDRFISGMTAVREFGAEVIVLDDAFQHIRLERDLDLVLVDARRPFGNGRLLPRGPLREPPGALSRGDAVILTRCRADAAAAVGKIRKTAAACQIFKSTQTPFVSQVIVASAKQAGAAPNAPPDAGRFRGLRVFAFAGLADNASFRASLAELGCRLCGCADFADHHRYSGADLDGILQAAGGCAAEVIATTEKDFSKICGRIGWPLDLVVMGVRTSFGEEEAAFVDFLRKRLVT